MDPDGAPVVENPDLPSMSEPSSSDVMGGSAVVAGGNVMSEPPPHIDPGAGGDYPEMEPVRPPGGRQDERGDPAGGHGPGYVRLVIDVEDGAMRVVDAAVVDGPLIQTDLTGQMAYEALVRGRRVAADAFDDLSQQHAFAPPDDPTVGHTVATTSRYQFVARIPLAEVTAADFADLEITLVKPADTSRLAAQARAAPGASFEAAAVQAGDDTPEIVGRVQGVDLGTLRPGAADEVRRRLG
jgi:hypothetical protein